MFYWFSKTRSLPITYSQKCITLLFLSNVVRLCCLLPFQSCEVKVQSRRPAGWFDQRRWGRWLVARRTSLWRCWSRWSTWSGNPRSGSRTGSVLGSAWAGTTSGRSGIARPRSCEEENWTTQKCSSETIERFKMKH